MNITLDQNTAPGFREAEVTDRVTKEYVIWNIGKNAPDGYVLFGLRQSYDPEDMRFYSLVPGSIKAVRSSHAAEIMDAAHWAVSIPEAEAFIKKHLNSSNYERRGARKLAEQFENIRALYAQGGEK